MIQQLFTKFCGGQTNSQGNPSMDLSKLLGFTDKMGIQDKNLSGGDITDIFNQIKGIVKS